MKEHFTKKTIVLLLAMIVALSLCACNQAEPSVSDDKVNEDTVEAQTPKPDPESPSASEPQPEPQPEPEPVSAPEPEFDIQPKGNPNPYGGYVSGPIDDSQHISDLLAEVLVGKRQFVNYGYDTSDIYTSINERQYINDMQVDGERYKPRSFSVVDLDGNGVNEIVVLCAYYGGAFLALHEYSGEVYGHMVVFRAMGDLQRSGLFIGSSGARYAYLQHFTFDKDKANIEVIAEIVTDDNGASQINGQSVTDAEYEAFMRDVGWTLDDEQAEAPFYVYANDNLKAFVPQSVAESSLPLAFAYHLSATRSVYEEMYNCAVNLVDNGAYAEYTGNIGDVIPLYADVDLDGDAKPEMIERRKTNDGYSFVVDYGYRGQVETKAGGYAPNEGEVLQFHDMGGNTGDVILTVRYTDSTGGPVATSAVVYYWKDRAWQAKEIVGDAYAANFEKLIDGFAPSGGSDYKVVSVELTDYGIAVLIDYGHKDGADQTFDYESLLLSFDEGELKLLRQSHDDVARFWPKGVG